LSSWKEFLCVQIPQPPCFLTILLFPADQTNPDCVLEGILLKIIAGQNHEVQMMKSYLRDHNYPQEDNCEVFVQTVDDQGDVKLNLETSASTGASAGIAALLLGAVSCVLGF